MTALAPAIWGTTYLVTSELLPPGRPLLAAVVRALPAGLVLVALTRRLPQGSWWWRAVVLGALNIGAFFALLFVAAYRLPGGVAATIIAVQPLLVVALSGRLLGELVAPRVVIAGAAGVVGVGLLVLRGGTTLDAIGVAAALGAAAVMATGIVLSKRWPSPAPLLATTGWQLVAGGLRRGAGRARRRGAAPSDADARATSPATPTSRSSELPSRTRSGSAASARSPRERDVPGAAEPRRRDRARLDRARPARSRRSRRWAS